MAHEKTDKLHWNVALGAAKDKIGDLAGHNKTKPFYAGFQAASTYIKWSGTPTGTLTLYASVNHNSEDVAASQDPWNGDWVAIDSLLNPAPTDPAGSAGNNAYSLEGIAFRAYYWDYQRTGGSGQAEAWFGREING